MKIRAGVILLTCALSGCAKEIVSAPPVAQGEWARARQELAAMRSEVPREPYVEVIRVALREPRTGRVIEGRGAVAVDPRRAMRLVLLGPGGRTALDVWVTRDAWRFSVPSLELTRRGEEARSSDDVPVGFFRWWFLDPLGGRLLSAAPDRHGARWFVLRDGAATVNLRHVPDKSLRHYVAVRREARDVDRLEWIARGLRPGPGDRAIYTQRATGLQIEIQVESLSEEAPDPAAFIDPDARGVAL